MNELQEIKSMIEEQAESNSDQPKILAQCEWGTVYADGSCRNSAGTLISRFEMKEIVKSYAGANRIYKPFLVLFYTDVLNGRKSNWVK